MENSTDYTFPEDWGLRTPEQKDFWYKQERAYRQAMRQDTTWGRMAREYHADSEYKVDEDKEFQ
jgi:hypothetical protein